MFAKNIPIPACTREQLLIDLYDVVGVKHPQPHFMGISLKLSG